MRSILVLAALGSLGACGGAQSNNHPSSEPPPPEAGVMQQPADEEMRAPTSNNHAAHDLRVVERRVESSPLVTIRVVFSSGSADDPTGREGLTRLLADVMAEGGTEALTYEQLTRRLFPMAASIDFHVDRDMTVFVGQVHRDRIAEFYPLFRDVILHPRLADDDFHRIRQQSVSALTVELRGNDDEQLGKEFLQSLIYANHPYGHPALGTERGLQAASVDDVRAHRPRVFCRDRIFVGLAGGYPASLAQTVHDDFMQLPATCPARAPLPAVARPDHTHIVLIDKPGVQATAISIGFPVTYTRRDRDFAAVQFVTNYLGLHRQSSGVLYQTIREARGLNYGDYAYAEHFEQEPGTRFPMPNIQRTEQYASIWIRPVRPSNAHFALRAALRALSNTLDQGIAAADFDRTRTFLGGYVNLYAQTESERLGYALDDLWTGVDDGSYAERMRSQWQALDPDAVIAAARRQLTARDLWVAIVAPNARELAEAIAHNAPSPITYDSPKPATVTAEDHEIESYALSVRPDDVRVVPLADVFR